MQKWLLLLALQMLLFLDASEEIITKTKRSLFGIKEFIKKLQKLGKLNRIVFSKRTQNDLVTDEVGLPNDVIYVRLRNHHKYFY